MKDKYYHSDSTTSIRRDYSKTLHRTDGPAVEYASGTKVWYRYGILHREDGPAIEWANGDKIWFIHGKAIVCYHVNTGNYELYDAARTVITEEQVRLVLVKHGIQM